MAALEPPAGVAAAPAPSDAVVLFDGRSLAAWETSAGAAPTWKIENGYAEVVPRRSETAFRYAAFRWLAIASGSLTARR